MKETKNETTYDEVGSHKDVQYAINVTYNPLTGFYREVELLNNVLVTTRA